MKVLVTGSSGFIGKNLMSALKLQKDIDVLEFSRNQSSSTLPELVLQADFIFHLAGVNRPQNESAFTKDNVGLTKDIVNILRSSDKKTPLVVTSSIQAELDNPYGKSKLEAERIVIEWGRQSDAPIYVYRLPGIFGKWCKPNYNSVVATFCFNTINHLPIEVSDPSKIITLSYIDDVINSFIGLIDRAPGTTKRSGFQSINRTFDVSLGELKNRIDALHNIRTKLLIPDLNDTFNKFLYATYTSYLPADQFSYNLSKNSDERGWLTEFVKSNYGGQVFISSTKPGISRGNHWHKTKIEKFLVINGSAEIILRNKVNDSAAIKYMVSGDDMSVIDIPVGYVHAIKNIGKTELLTIFWASEILDKQFPDTFYEEL